MVHVVVHHDERRLAVGKAWGAGGDRDWHPAVEPGVIDDREVEDGARLACGNDHRRWHDQLVCIADRQRHRQVGHCHAAKANLSDTGQQTAPFTGLRRDGQFEHRRFVVTDGHDGAAVGPIPHPGGHGDQLRAVQKVILLPDCYRKCRHGLTGGDAKGRRDAKLSRVARSQAHRDVLRGRRADSECCLLLRVTLGNFAWHGETQSS